MATPDAIKAADALAGLGSLAAVPVAAVLERIPSEPRRLMLVELLRDIPPAVSLQVSTTLLRLAADDPSERVRAAASETFGVLRRRSPERFRRLDTLQARQAEIAAERRRQDEAAGK